MGRIYQQGFTIIETMLFLAITGVLIVTILASTGTSINIQRYRDSVLSLQTTIQDQYSEVINVRNQLSSEALTCATVTGDATAILPRGQGKCVILGRYITTANNQSLNMSTVIGYINSSIEPNSNDLAILKQYKLDTIASSLENYEIEWGASLLKAGGDEPLAFSLLILRSPSSGIVRTFIDPANAIATKDIASLLNTAYLTQPLKACIDAGGLFGTSKMAVTIGAGATNSSGVEVVGDGSSQC